MYIQYYSCFVIRRYDWFDRRNVYIPNDRRRLMSARFRVPVSETLFCFLIPLGFWLCPVCSSTPQNASLCASCELVEMPSVYLERHELERYRTYTG